MRVGPLHSQIFDHTIWKVGSVLRACLRSHWKSVAFGSSSSCTCERCTFVEDWCSRALSRRPVIAWLSFAACVKHLTGLGVIHGKSDGDSMNEERSRSNEKRNTCFKKERPSADVCLCLLLCKREAPRTVSVLKNVVEHISHPALGSSPALLASSTNESLH